MRVLSYGRFYKERFYRKNLPDGSVVKNLLVIYENWTLSLGWKDPLEKGTATHSSILAWRSPWTGEPVGYCPWNRRFRHDWVTNTHFMVKGKKNEAKRQRPGHCFSNSNSRHPKSPRGFVKTDCCIGIYLSGLLHSVKWAPVSSISLELIQMNSF